MANTCFLEKLKEKKVLIIGGGDGVSYRKLSKELNGEFWEISASMLTRAKQNLQKSGLEFHLGHFQSDQKFDLISLPFVLDTMRDAEILNLLKSLRGKLTQSGRLVLSDFFQPQTKGQTLLHWGMLSFFRLFAGHERKNIPDYESLLMKAGFQRVREKKWRGGWIRAQIWE